MGDPFDFLKIQSVAKYQKKLWGDPLETFKKQNLFRKVFEKKTKNEIFESLIVPQKLERGTLSAF